MIGPLGPQGPAHGQPAWWWIGVAVAVLIVAALTVLFGITVRELSRRPGRKDWDR